MVGSQGDPLVGSKTTHRREATVFINLIKSTGTPCPLAQTGAEATKVYLVK
jgi:hypothetical protein